MSDVPNYIIGEEKDAGGLIRIDGVVETIIYSNKENG